VGATLLLGLLGANSFVLLHAPTETSFGGRRLTEWLRNVPMPDPSGARAAEIEEARHALEQMSPDAFPYMLSMMRATDSRLRAKINALLTKPTWLNLRLPPAPSVLSRWEAARGFAILGGKAQAVVPALSRMLRDPETAGQAAVALAHIGTDEAWRALEGGLRSQDVRVRQTILGPLEMVSLPTDRLVPALLERLDDPDAWVREGATRLLGWIATGPERVVPALADRLGDRSSNVRRAAACSLHRFGERAQAAIPALQAALFENDPTYRQAVEQALQGIRGRDAMCVGRIGAGAPPE
jgi:HEAT repeat protein